MQKRPLKAKLQSFVTLHHTQTFSLHLKSWTCLTCPAGRKKYAEGMVDVPDYTFGANYTKTAYDKLKAMEGDDTIVFELRFGATGEYGAWTWTGSMFVNIKGGEVGGKREMEITSYPQSDITPTTVSDT